MILSIYTLHSSSIINFLKGEKSYHEIDQKSIKDFEDHGIPFYVIPQAGHGMMGDNPKAFYSVVSKVLGDPDLRSPDTKVARISINNLSFKN